MVKVAQQSRAGTAAAVQVQHAGCVYSMHACWATPGCGCSDTQSKSPTAALHTCCSLLFDIARKVKLGSADSALQLVRQLCCRCRLLQADNCCNTPADKEHSCRLSSRTVVSLLHKAALCSSRKSSRFSKRQRMPVRFCCIKQMCVTWIGLMTAAVVGPASLIRQPGP
jgi:hypothetical protein